MIKVSTYSLHKTLTAYCNSSTPQPRPYSTTQLITACPRPNTTLTSLDIASTMTSMTAIDMSAIFEPRPPTSSELAAMEAEYAPKQVMWQGERDRNVRKGRDVEGVYNKGLKGRFNQAYFSGLGNEAIPACSEEEISEDLRALGLEASGDDVSEVVDPVDGKKRNKRKRAEPSAKEGNSEPRAAYAEYTKHLKKYAYTNIRENVMDIDMDEEMVGEYAREMGDHHVEVMASNERPEVAARKLQTSTEANPDWEAFKKERVAFSQAFELRETRGYEVGALLECVDFENHPIKKGLVSLEELANILPYPLCETSFLNKYVQPLFEEAARNWSQGTLVERLDGCEALARELLEEVNAVDAEWREVAARKETEWLDPRENRSKVSPSRTYTICNWTQRELEKGITEAKVQQESARWKFRTFMAWRRAKARCDTQMEGQPILATDLPEAESLVERESAALAVACFVAKGKANILQERLEAEDAATKLMGLKDAYSAYASTSN